MKTARKRLFTGLGLALWLAVGAPLQADIEIGDTYDAVLARLGKPDGYIKTETMSWLYYDRGTVKLEDGRVVEAELISADQALERRTREREVWEQRRVRQAEQQAERLREGWALKQARLADPGFLASPPSQQVDYWRTFQARYPDVPVHAEYARALEWHQVERDRALQERETARRIRELEDRVRRAEDRALAQSYSGARRSAYYGAPAVVYATSPTPYYCPGRTITLISGLPVSHQRTGPVAMSYADRVFGPMPTMSAPGFRGSYQTSGRTSSMRISF